jgi:hypothetical protein
MCWTIDNCPCQNQVRQRQGQFKYSFHHYYIFTRRRRNPGQNLLLPLKLPGPSEGYLRIQDRTLHQILVCGRMVLHIRGARTRACRSCNGRSYGGHIREAGTRTQNRASGQLAQYTHTSDLRQRFFPHALFLIFQ